MVNEANSPVLVYIMRVGEAGVKCITLQPQQEEHVPLASGESTEMLSSQRFVILAITSSGQVINVRSFRLGDIEADNTLKIKEERHVTSSSTE